MGPRPGCRITPRMLAYRADRATIHAMGSGRDTGSSAEVEEFRAELERAALAAEGFDGLLRRLGAGAGRPVWLVAVHGGVLAALPGTAEPLAASTPASGVVASDSVEGGLDSSDVRRHIL